MKACSKCGFQGEAELFKKNKNVCKQCQKKYDKKRYEENSDKILKQKKEYYEENSDKILKQKKEYYKENPDKKKEYNKKYYEENSDKVNERNKKYYEENSDKILKQKKEYYEENSDKILEYNKKYRQTPNGKEAIKRYNSKRRNLGHEPLNAWFKGSEVHHLRYSKNPKLQDNDITIHVPRKLHRSIAHNGNTGKGMRETNITCLEWYFENTPKEEHNPKAIQLYWNYCTLPEPEWKQ